MLVHQIILTKKQKQKTTMKNIIRTIKKQVILFTFCVNILLCFASCAYFSAAETKMQEVRQIQRDAEEVMNTPDLTGDWGIEELEEAVRKDLKSLEAKQKRKQISASLAKR
jgi:hypothetical protein